LQDDTFGVQHGSKFQEDAFGMQHGSKLQEDTFGISGSCTTVRSS
jgi:hypothetical protein